MMEAMHSTPKYQSIQELNGIAAQFLLITQYENSEQSQQLAAALHSDQAVTALSLPSQHDDALARLMNQVEALLQQQKAGIHVVICGDEAFVWMVQQCCIRSGCLKEELSLIVDQSTQQQSYKKVYCVHCGQTQHSAEQDICLCRFCKVELMIRSHFSERLGAYMGVCANAHQPKGGML